MEAVFPLTAKEGGGRGGNAPGRRSADACESFGACLKKIVKHLTSRNHITASRKVGFVEQAFKRACVRSSLLHGSENEPYRSREDWKLVGYGRVSDKAAHAYGPHYSVRVKVELECDNA